MTKNFIVSSFVALSLLGLMGCEKHAKVEEAADISVNILEDSAGVTTNAAVMNTDAQNAVAMPAAPQVAVENSQTTPSPVDDMTASGGNIIKPTAQQIQTALKNAEFYHGKVDGVLGPQTKRAVRNFQEKNDLAIDGRVGPKTWEKLGTYLDTPAAAPSAPQEYPN